MSRVSSSETLCKKTKKYSTAAFFYSYNAVTIYDAYLCKELMSAEQPDLWQFHVYGEHREMNG
jgi:hypothetical protein